MELLGSFVIACSMYSRIPMPQVEWTKKRMAYALCFFPMIGIVIGITQFACFWVLNYLELTRIYVFLAAVIPLMITGGIHMDGFLDVTDARASHGERDRKLEILKDPHTGAFAIIGFGVYLLLYLSALSCLEARDVPVYGMVFVLTRALSGLSVVAFPKAKNTGLVSTFSSQAEKRVVTVTMLLYLAAGFLWLFWFFGVWMCAGLFVAGAASYGYYYRMSKKEFGGITGDLAGHFLQICELAMLTAIVLMSKAAGILC